MQNSGSKIKEYEFSGKLSRILEEFIKEKRAVGYIYNTEAKKLSEFSRFSLSFDYPDDTLTKKVVQAWISKKSTDSTRNQYARYSLISQFAKYMQRMGYSAYVPGKDEIPKIHTTFIPYIFTHQEIKNFFEAADAMQRPAHSVSPRRHLIMPVLFRMLYCCGLRVSEATHLHGEDVDLTNGILTIKESKFGKSRYVPMSKELTARCAAYAETRLVGDNGNDWFFASIDGGCYDTRSIYHVFRILLWNAGISHGGKGNGPRLHDLRHTFAVHSMQMWTSNGGDPTVMLPRLSAYLGHNNLAATEQYLRMTAEVYPELANILQKTYGYIIPLQEDD